MLEFVRGNLVEAFPARAIVDVRGVGYRLAISLKTFHKLPPIASEVFFYVHLVVREDAHLLFGFLDLEERAVFEQLIGVNGIGPKIALAILGHIDIPDFQTAVVHGNTALLSKIPGIGNKSAHRLVVELKDLFSKKGTVSSSTSAPSVASDAIAALVHLGYRPLDAQHSVNNILVNQERELSLSELITHALRSI